VATRPLDLLLSVTQEQILVLHKRSAVGPRAGAGVRSPERVAGLVSSLHLGAERGDKSVELIAKIFANINRDPQPFTDCDHRTAKALDRLVARSFGPRCVTGQTRSLR